MPSKATKTVTKTATKAVTKTPVAKRATVATLAEALKALETRLKGADTKNRNALKKLQGVVAQLEASAVTSTRTQKSALTRRFNTLDNKIEAYLERATQEARTAVREELSSVAAPGADLQTLAHALLSAESRLENLETEQSAAIARLNRHVADLATAVEARLTSERSERLSTAAALDARIDTVQSGLEARLDQIETETATALEAVGDKVTEFATVLDDRARRSDADTAERLADLAQETQSEFSHTNIDVKTRLEALETIASNWSPTPNAANQAGSSVDHRVDQMDATLASLQGELARLHARLATVQAGAPTTPEQGFGQGFGNVVPLAQTQPAQLTAHVPPLPQSTNMFDYAEDNPYADAARTLQTSVPPGHMSEATVESTVTPTPEIKTKDKPLRESHIPEEFDPSAYMPAPVEISGQSPTLQEVAQAPHPTLGSSFDQNMGLQSQSLAAPSMRSDEAPLSMAALRAPLEQQAPQQLAPPPPMPGVNGLSMPPVAKPSAPQLTSGYSALEDTVMPAPLPVATYADPAYAENPYSEAGEMRAERITEGSRRPSLPNLPISGRNLRLAGLVAGVAVVGIFAAKTVFGGDDAPRMDLATTPTSDVANVSELGGASTLSSVDDFTGTTAPTAPIGQYAETRTPNIDTQQKVTLESAVADGNPIAQFQMGLTKLRDGDMDEAARLIRLAANRNQPAAQYRLAKLYETGTGVAKDLITARELVERAAIGGNRIAMHDLGNYYAYGQGGIDRDVNEALRWFEKAAERGVVDSQFNVGYLREGNEGVRPDLETALFWYTIAATQGDQGAPERIALLSASMDEATLADINDRAERFAPKSIDEAANGIFRDVPWAAPDLSAQAAEAARARAAQITKVREAQTLLTELGYQIGGADGAAGPKTQSAIREFEAVNGLPETGEVTDALIQRLEIAAGA